MHFLITFMINSELEPWLNRIHVGDCLELMARMPAESVDLVVTSPPYNLRNTTGGGFSNPSNTGKWQGSAYEVNQGYENYGDYMAHSEYVKWQRKCLMSMLRVLKNTGAIMYNHKWRVQNGLLQDRADIMDGFPVAHIFIWQRAGGMNFNPSYFLPTYEVIYLIAKPEFRITKKLCGLGDIWKISQVQGNPHPAPFPVELAANCIKITDADVVLDPFIGSGSTAIAADTLGKDFIGIDISSEYCDLARGYLNKADAILWE